MTAGRPARPWLPGRLARDYEDWLALGPGGLPANGFGWLASTALRPLARPATTVTPYAGAPAVAPALDLPPRTGPRPALGRHPIPHRQLDQLPAPQVRRATAALTREVADAAPDRLVVRTSRYERRGDAVFALDPAAGPVWLATTGGEAGHVHPSDGSLHLVLPPADAAAAVTAGWAERHPLAGVPGLGIPVHYLLVYAPRTDAEVDVVRRLFLRAAGTG